MKLKFYRCISLLLAVVLLMSTVGCWTATYITTDYKPSNVQPVAKPKKLLYVRYNNWSDYKKGLHKSESETLVHLRERLHLAYPTVFSNVRTRDTIDVTLHEWYYDMGQESGFEKLWTVASIVTGCMILPTKLSYWHTRKVCLSYEVGEDLKKEELSPIRTPWISGDYCKSTYTGNLITPLFGWFFSPFHDYILTDDEIFSVDDKEFARIDSDVTAAMCMASFNKAPTVFDGPEVEAYRVRKEKEAREKALEEARKKKEAQRQALENLDYYIVRQSFDAQTNIGTYRVQFKNNVPEVKELVQLQKDLLAFCYTKLRENNLEFDSRYVSVLQEDYRAIGKSLTLYEFTIKLGAVEFLDLQYDNSTLLGTISIRLPGGNPTNARKWVTENLDRLVEEYNISADNPIEGEYQLSSEKMSADGTYTVAFEVVN